MEISRATNKERDALVDQLEADCRAVSNAANALLPYMGKFAGEPHVERAMTEANQMLRDAWRKLKELDRYL